MNKLYTVIHILFLKKKIYIWYRLESFKNVGLENF